MQQAGLIPLTRSQTHAPVVELWSLNHWAIGKSQHFLTCFCYCEMLGTAPGHQAMAQGALAIIIIAGGGIFRQPLRGPLFEAPSRVLLPGPTPDVYCYLLGLGSRSVESSCEQVWPGSEDCMDPSVAACSEGGNRQSWTPP